MSEHNNSESRNNNMETRVTILEQTLDSMQTLINYQLSILTKQIEEVQSSLDKLVNNGTLDAKIEKQFMVLSGKFFWKVLTAVLLAGVTSGGLFTLLARMIVK